VKITWALLSMAFEKGIIAKIQKRKEIGKYLYKPLKIKIINANI